MRIFILADIHGNLPALQAVLADWQRFQPNFDGEDRVICLGDVIGYYANPNEVMEQVWDLTDVVLIGNHELSIYEFLRAREKSKPSTYGVHPHAAWAFQWTADNLNTQNRRRLMDLVESRKYAHEDKQHRIIYAHSAPWMPELMEYVISGTEAYYSFFEPPECRWFQTAFIGHSHVPQFYRQILSPDERHLRLEGGVVKFLRQYEPVPDGLAASADEKSLLWCESADDLRFEKSWALPAMQRTLISVPSVGQPRDRMPYSGYAVYDLKQRQVTMVRLAYNIDATVAAMEKLPGCPENLIKRLRVGR